MMAIYYISSLDKNIMEHLVGERIYMYHGFYFAFVMCNKPSLIFTCSLKFNTFNFI